MQDDALQEIAKGHVAILRGAFEDFEQGCFQANAGLASFDGAGHKSPLSYINNLVTI
jgi:hypothetical protein